MFVLTNSSSMHPAIQCRVCATSDVGCILVNIFDKHGQHESVADMLLELADVTAAEDDQFPHHCCTQCQQDLVQAVTVRRKCIESEKLLRICIESGNSNEQYDDKQFDKLSVASSDQENATLGKSPFYHCCECGTDFFDSDTLQNHYESMHANAVHGWESFGISEISFFDSTDDEVEDTPSKDNVPYEDKGIPHRCCGCKYLFDTETELQLHCETVHRPNAMKVDEDRPAQCNICYQTFTTACGMRVHQRAMRVLRYQCAVCGKLFGNRAACIIHETNHEDHQLSCDLCAKKFTNRKYLNIHKQNVHTDPETRKKYVCNVCGTSVHSASYLKAHMMLHSEDAPYACSLCEHRFKLLMYLNRHMKWHRGVYTCKQCGLRVKSASSLSNHMASHTGIQQYSCSICCSKYRYKESLKKHLRRKHGRSTTRKDRSE
uniref:Uncharacterized protein n=1 Tax=Anopheles gambiae TaxID=7165 RepID=A0A1S4HE19_ANOGA